MACKVCNSSTGTFFSLGDMPLVNSFLKKTELASEKKYDLTAAFCPNCFLAQLVNTVSPKDLFRHYLYFSSVSSSFLEHCRVSAEHLAKKMKLGQESLVLEIASNDGAMLRCFKALGINVLGIDPAKNIAEAANRQGLKTIPEFFNLRLAEKLAASGVKPDLIYGANVLAHVPEIVDFVKGVARLLKSKGTAVFEFPYIEGLFENKFDTIYHEHVFYYSLIALKNLFAKADMEIYDVEKIPVQGGSLRIFASHAGALPASIAVGAMEASELKKGWDKLDAYKKIRKNVSGLKRELRTLLENIKKEGKTVAAYGAPAKGNILLNYFGLKDYLSFIVDKATQKQGLCAPGTHLAVYPISKINEEKPDYLLVLCWNIFDEVKAMPELEKFKRSGGKFIVPVPKILIS